MSDRSLKICNNWICFHNDTENIKCNLIKKAYPSLLIDKVIKKYLDYKFSSNQNQLKKNLTFVTLIVISFSSVTSANAGISRKNFLTFSFNPFATLV